MVQEHLLSEILNIINSTNTVTAEDVTLIESYIEEMIFTDFRLLIEVI